MHAREVFELGKARPSHDRVTPRLSVAARSAVVHQHDGEAVVDPGLHLCGVRVLVVGLGPAVDDEDRRMRSRASRLGDEEMHAIGVLLGVGHTRGRTLARGTDHDSVAHRADLRRGRRVRPLVPNVAIGTNTRRRDRSGLGRNPLEPPRAEVDAVELAAAAVLVADEERAGIGVPLGERLARKIELDVVDAPRARVEEERLPPAAAIMQHEQPLVAGHW